MRRVIASVLSVAVQVAVLGAPLVHAHPDDHATGHHDGPAVHAHWSHHQPAAHRFDGPAVEDADHDRAIFLSAFVAEAATPLPAPGIVHAFFELPAAAERAAHRVIETVRSHGPPALPSISPRPPPSFLS